MHYELRRWLPPLGWHKWRQTIAANGCGYYSKATTVDTLTLNGTIVAVIPLLSVLIVFGGLMLLRWPDHCWRRGWGEFASIKENVFVGRYTFMCVTHWVSRGYWVKHTTLPQTLTNYTIKAFSKSLHHKSSTVSTTHRCAPTIIIHITMSLSSDRITQTHTHRNGYIHTVCLFYNAITHSTVMHNVQCRHSNGNIIA